MKLIFKSYRELSTSINCSYSLLVKKNVNQMVFLIVKTMFIYVL